MPDRSKMPDARKIDTDKLTAEQAKAEHARLAAEIGEHDGATTRRTRRPSPTPNTTRCGSATTEIEARFPELRTLRKPVAARSASAPAGRIRQGPPRGADALARQRVRRRRRDASSSSGSAASSADGGRAGRLHRRAEDRRPLLSLRYEGGRLARGAPGATARRRGRDRERQDARRHPAEARRQGRPGRSARCAARST